MALLCCYSMFMGLVAVVVVTVIVLPVIVTTIEIRVEINKKFLGFKFKKTLVIQ